MNKTRAFALLMTLMLIFSALPGTLAFAEIGTSSGARLDASKATSASALASKASKKKKKPKATPAPLLISDIAAETAEQPRAEGDSAAPNPTAKPEPEARPEPTQAPESGAAESSGDGQSSEQTAEPTEAKAEPTAKAAVTSKAPLVVEFKAMVNGVPTEEIVADPVEVKKNGKIDLNRINLKPSVEQGGKVYYLNPARWDPKSAEGVGKITKDKVVYALYDSARTANSSLSFSGKQGDTITISLPIAYLKDGNGSSGLMSNTSVDGGQIDAYGETTLPASFDQSFVTESGLKEMYAQVKTKDVPFTSSSISKANGDRVNASVVLGYNELPESMRAGLTAGTPANKGLAVFALTIANGAKVKTHSVPFDLFWTDASGSHQTVVYVKVKVSKKASTSSGGGGGSTGSDSSKPNPVPRVYIDDVTTDPENPKAGDKFMLIMNVINTSKNSYLQNMQLSWSAGDDSLMPQGQKTNVEYIERIDADSSYRLEIPVQALTELPNKLVKVDVNMEYEDKKVNAQSETQTLVVQVQPQQRIKIDEPKLPSGSAMVGESYEFELPISNPGKVILYNVTARIVPNEGDENLIAGGEVYYGNIEVAGNKSMTLECTPDAEGQYDATIEVSYETESGEVSVAEEKKKFSFTATEEDDYDSMWNDQDYLSETPTPEAPTALTIMKLLPPWLFAGVGGLVLLLVVSMSVSARKRRRRAMEDDEME